LKFSPSHTTAASRTRARAVSLRPGRRGWKQLSHSWCV